jgi:cell division protein FtsZ
MGSKVDRDIPAFIRERQRESIRNMRSTLGGAAGSEDEYDIPTFLRKRVD